MQSPIGSLQLVPVVVGNGVAVVVGVGVVPVNPPPVLVTGDEPDPELLLLFGRHPLIESRMPTEITARGILNCFIKYTFKKFLIRFIGGLP